jgi:hypothetical protein
MFAALEWKDWEWDVGISLVSTNSATRAWIDMKASGIQEFEQQNDPRIQLSMSSMVHHRKRRSNQITDSRPQIKLI